MSVRADYNVSERVMPLAGCYIKRPISKNADDGCLAFDEKFSNNLAKWGSRSIPAYLADSYYTGVTEKKRLKSYKDFNGTNQQTCRQFPGINQKIQSRFKNYHHNALTYKQLLGINTDSIKIGSHGDFETYRSLLSADGWQNYKTKVKSNFSNVFNTESSRNLSCKSYFTRTLIGGNIKSITQPLSEGKLFTPLSGIFGFSMLGWNIISKTKTAYCTAKGREDGSLGRRLKTLFSTASSFAGIAFKSLACWELGTIGAVIGSAVFCVGTMPSMIAGIACGSLLGAAGYKIISKVIPDPSK